MASIEDEFTAFAEAASPGLMATAFLLCGNWHSAQDLTQTTLARVFAAWRRISNQDAVHAYARRTLLNAYFVECRRTRRGEILTADAGDLERRPAEVHTPEVRLALMAALATLPPKARAVVVLRYWEDLSIEQVASLLACTPGNVKSQSSRALDKLRALLGDAVLSDYEDRGRGPDGRDFAPRAV
jgi:RNA polymerase sigma-70 factor (sigma-E family)